METDFWKNKLLAFLHDPPEKAYDYGPEHKKRAEAFANRVLGSSAWQGHEPDWAAAAADRFIFPDGSKIGQSLGEGVQFIHPLGGSGAGLKFPPSETAGDIISSVLPEFEVENPRLAFWLLWRVWVHHCVTHKSGEREGAETLAYLPADTRIPDASIWHHNAIVSALESTRGADGKLHPAFLLFQAGPVQEFIAQARSTRDLWSGSYLLSWMMAHALKIVADEFGPDAIIFPSLRGQPIYDWIEQERLKQAKYRDEVGNVSKSFWEEYQLRHEAVLTPGLPNRFLAVVRDDFDPRKIEKVFSSNEESEWRRICDTCWSWFEKAGHMPAHARKRWDYQIENFWHVTWQIWPWREVDETLNLLRETPLGKDAVLHKGREIARGIPQEHQDERCYREGKLNEGWAWSAHYQLLSHRHDARRNTRDFKSWRNLEKDEKPGHKDYFSGREEVVATNEWITAATRHPELRYLFRNKDELGAINFIKRVWSKACLDAKHGLHRGSNFDSVPAIAAAPWRARVLLRLKETDKGWHELLGLQDKINAAAEVAAIDVPNTDQEGKWFEKIDAGVFHESFWENIKLRKEQEQENALREDALRALREFTRALDGKKPATYYAVLALDGDEMGKWISGDKTPAIERVITSKAADYFRENVSDAEQWLGSHRPVSPSYHLQFSEALANFGLYCARRIVEAHHGQLIYSGGDDVMAMLPADEALSCAIELRNAFRGEIGSENHSLFSEAPAGFISLKHPEASEPSWPMLVPGPEATISAGIAIGHIKEPLQDMVAEAQAAEKRAKANPKTTEGWGRDALAVTLFKRSGEMIHWGAKFDSPAFDLLDLFQQHYRKPIENPSAQSKISGRFPYALIELLQRYECDEPLDDNLRQIALADFDHVVDRQAKEMPQRDRFRELSEMYLQHLQHFSHKSNGEEENVPRPLREFFNLFALEAFIARQGE